MRLYFIAVLFFPVLAASQVWTQLPDFPGTKRDDGAAAVLNGVAYFGTGLDEGWTSTGDWHALDLYAFTWSAIPPMPAGTQRQYACAFTSANRIFVFGGDGPGGPLNDLYCYDPSQKTWEKRAPLPDKGLIAAACMTFGDKTFVVGGKVRHDSLPSRKVWEYNATNDTWQRKSDFPYNPRWRAAAATLGPWGYLAGGHTSDTSRANDLLAYDPGTDIWHLLGVLPVDPPTTYATLQPLTNKLVLFGGQRANGSYPAELWYYRPAQADWQQGPPIPSNGRRGGMAVGWNEKFVYTCGLGPSDQRLNESWTLDLPLGSDEPPAERFEIYPNPFEEQVHIHAANPGFTVTVCSPDGRVILQTETTGSQVEIFTQTWTPGLYLAEFKWPDGTVERTRLIRR